MVNITDEDWKKLGYPVTQTGSIPPSFNPSTSTANMFCKDYKDRIVELPDPNALRPEHYGGKDNVFEVFNVLDAWGLDKDFYLGNVIKYVARAGKKNKSKEKEDLQKALVYLQKRIDSL